MPGVFFLDFLGNFRGSLLSVTGDQPVTPAKSVLIIHSLLYLTPPENTRPIRSHVRNNFIFFVIFKRFAHTKPIGIRFALSLRFSKAKSRE